VFFFCEKNEGSFGCEVFACVAGQPNVPECAWGNLIVKCVGQLKL